MSVGLRVLIVEDEPQDAMLIEHTLRRNGFERLFIERVDTAAGMQAALNRQSWDIILADYALPQFSALGALALLKERGQDTPLIIVSGQIGEMQAVAAIRAGAYDYVSKQHLSSLSPTVERTLREAEIRRERQRAAAAVRAGEARYRAIVEGQTDLICRYLPDGTLTFVNQAFCRFCDRPYHELIGKRYQDQIDLHPDDAVFVLRKRQRLSPQQPTITCWHRTRRPNGEIRWLHWSDHAFYDAEGDLVEIQSVGQDITERMQADAALRQRNQELQALNAIATSIHQALTPTEVAHLALNKTLSVLHAESGCVHLVEESGDRPVLQLIAHCGLTPAAAAMLHSLPLLPPPSYPPDALSSPANVESILAVAHAAVREQEADIPVNLLCAPLRSRDRLLGALSIFKNQEVDNQPTELQLLTTIGYQVGAAIENLRLAQKASEMEVLREVDRLRSELIANVSHELRTPLGLITILCTTLLRDDASFDAQTQREFLRDIEEEARNLEKIVDNLLDTSRLQSGRLRLNKRLTDIGRLIRETLEALQPQLTHHHFVCDLPPQPLVTLADGKRLEQVVRNLISNAIKYSPQGGPITIRVQQRETEIIVRISDRGIGISPEDLERIFERFYRVENENTYNVPGLGLGLSICRSLIEAHGGHIWAESQLGFGSTFTFTLPIETEANSSD